ncbi:hypothetical protein TRSC58_07522 [Trypanosoma rangeli SC58]|uniref:Uncharacterized protein n=1 Tax=Trypanosoma rangeli SC58 TaxID=429131 RepID=A0A061ISN5_TRYRA|nr:hypothetical protein TRSC58_07522 [Trypanosoma rangeli SC58]
MSLCNKYFISCHMGFCGEVGMRWWWWWRRRGTMKRMSRERVETAGWGDEDSRVKCTCCCCCYLLCYGGCM